MHSISSSGDSDSQQQDALYSGARDSTVHWKESSGVALRKILSHK